VDRAFLFLDKKSGCWDCLNSKKGLLSDKLLLFKLLPLTWAVSSGKLQLVFFCQGFDATADSYTIQKGFQIAKYKDII